MTTWNLDPPPGFQGLHPDKPLQMYQRHLPHWRQAGATYFVTFRLADSLPTSKLDELRFYRTEWERLNPPPRDERQWDELWRETFLRVDRWLDQGVGECLLRKPSFEQDKEALERITHSWKRYTSREINKLLGRNGPLWHEESFDRIVRDEEHLWRTIQYIGRNPHKAGLTHRDCPVWGRPTWEELGWRFEEEPS